MKFLVAQQMNPLLGMPIVMLNIFHTFADISMLILDCKNLSACRTDS